MQVGYLFLRRLWQYNRDVTHTGGNNHYSVRMGGLTHVLTPLLRREAYEDQLKIKKSYDEFVGWQTEGDNVPTGTKNYFLVQEQTDVPSYSIDCLVFFVASLYLDKKLHKVQIR